MAERQLTVTVSMREEHTTEGAMEDVITWMRGMILKGATECYIARTETYGVFMGAASVIPEILPSGQMTPTPDTAGMVLIAPCSVQ